MTRDFRNIGRLPTRADTPITAGSVAPAPRAGGRRLILNILYFYAISFLAAGIWLLLEPPELFGDQVSRLIGIVAVVSAVADLVAALVLRRYWRAGDRGRR